ncbi:MAG: M28 family metallopeptidase [Terriglobia bacterium]|jgi:Zn-dependent M28 family amino/carboxypeptidase
MSRKGSFTARVLPLVISCAFLGTPHNRTLGAAGSNPEKAAGKEISKVRLLETIKVLSSDEFEGRAPASKGEEKTVAFLDDQVRQIGLRPGNPDGTYLQKVPMVGITADPSMSLVFKSAESGRKLELRNGNDFVAVTKREIPEVSVNAPVVFVGYGVVAPEYQWDDYKGVDVTGKILVMLINDPPVPDPNDPSKLDDKVFKGRAMTYYGRWTYKYEIAAEKKAAGCIIIHETGPAGYPWEVLSGSNAGEEFDLVRPDKGLSRSAVEAWMTHDKAKALFAMMGKDLDALKQKARRRDFQPVALGASASLTIRNKLRMIDSANVAARLDGADPKLRDQYVIYSAHWDHFGIGPAVNGDKIYHGAYDNASGVAGVLEMARAFAKVQPPPRRSILFLFVTAEEQGLLGSEYYAEHPLVPLQKTLAEINVDEMNVLGRTRDVTLVGMGMTTLDDYVRAAAAEQGRVVKPDPEPEKGFYFRSDHFNFAKEGVPALDPNDGVDFVGKPEGWGLTMRRKFTSEDYHKPSDKIKAYWDLSGLVEDVQLFFEVGYRVANAEAYPEWKPGSEFKARREAMLKAATGLK